MVFDWFKQLFKKKSLNQSEITQSIESLNQSQPSNTDDIRLQKDALELGLAAGYAGRSLRSIESSLERMESAVVTKDWLTEKFANIIESHESNEQKRFEIIISILNSLHNITEKAPFEIKPELRLITQHIETQGKLAPRMVKLIQTVKEAGEVSYKDLAPRLGISEDCLRGLVSIILRKSNEIEKFEKDRRGWLRYVSSSQKIGESLTHSLEAPSQNEKEPLE